MTLSPIPEPLVVTKQGATRSTLMIQCHHCERRRGRNQLARYELHWRVTHDAMTKVR